GTEVEPLSPVAEALRKLGDVGTLDVHARNEVERGVDGAQHGRRQRGRIDEARAAIDEVLAYRIRASDIAAEAAKRLREGADGDIGVIRKPPSLLAENARR